MATLTFLGTGTSMGVPTLGCDCPVCIDAHRPGSRNRRTRPSIRVDYNAHTVLIDTGQDFRQQALREKIQHVDAVLYTHSHADHILGLDDLRPLSFRHAAGMPLYADDKTIEKKDRTISEPLQFYTGSDHVLYELVVFTADKNKVTGYLSTPKNAAAPAMP